MGIIKIEDIRLRGFHGCLPEEARIGGKYLVDVTIDTDLSKPSVSDHLADTVDYVKVYEIVKAEMAQRSKLIEHAAKRILEHLRTEFSMVKSIEVKVTKLNPPINGDVEKVSVLLVG